MDEELILPVVYKGREYGFPFRVLVQGFATRYAVLVEGVEVIYERDDSGELRAIIYGQEDQGLRLPEPGLLQAISEVIEMLSK